MQDFKKILSANIVDLKKSLHEARRTLFKMRMGVAIGQQKDVSQIRKQRRGIAQMLTAIKQKEISELIK